MYKIAYYISSHGYGHLVRTLEILKNFKADNVIIVSDLNDKTLSNFENDLKYKIRKSSIDVGVIQENALDMELEKTLYENLNILKNEKNIIEREIEFLKREKINYIFSDIPPLIFKIANILKIPAYGVSNFSWDWIYEGFQQFYPDFEIIKKKYWEYNSYANGIFELPFSKGLNSFKRKFKTNLITRKPKFKKTEDIRKFLNLSNEKKYLLLSFGGFNFLPELSEIKNIVFLIPSDKTQWINSFTFEVSTKDISHPDLVLCSDYIFSKPGYGILSEVWYISRIMKENKVFIYTDRGPFREYFVLEKFIKKGLKHFYIHSCDIKTNKWIKILRKWIYEKMGR